VKDALAQCGAIAIVDDDEPLREALASVLRAAGLPVAAFASAEEFLESAYVKDAGCVILDVRLPGMSGVDLQRQLARAGSKVPIIFVTAHGDERLRDLVTAAGASDFLNKPVRSGVLLQAIRNALRAAQQN
jgi:FixJ family two-component response regulator